MVLIFVHDDVDDKNLLKFTADHRNHDRYVLLCFNAVHNCET